MQLVVAHLESVTGCLTIAIRVRRDGDFPIAVAHGMPPWLLESESSLRRDAQEGSSPCRNCDSGKLACLCGAVIDGAVGDESRFVTRAGSVFYNNLQRDAEEATRLLGGREYRGKCERAAFQSLGLIPIRRDGQTLGLIMLADVRRDMLPRAMVTYTEHFAAQTAKSLGDLVDNLVPICVNCSRIRTMDDSWLDIEAFLLDRTGTRVSHTLCPECASKLYPELSAGLA